MFLVAVLFLIVGILIFHGKTDLIHDYHQTNVKDKASYGKAMGKPIAGIGVVAVISGIISLLTDYSKDAVTNISVGVFVIGFIVCFLFIWKAQKKYNGGMF